MSEQTSKRVAQLAGKVLRMKRLGELRPLIERSPELAEQWLETLAASALTQAPDKQPRKSLLKRLVGR